MTVIRNVWPFLYQEIIKNKEQLLAKAHAELNGTAHLIDPKTIDFAYNKEEYTLEICTNKTGIKIPIIPYAGKHTQEEITMAEILVQEIRTYQTSKLEQLS